MDNILERIYKLGLKFLTPLNLEETYQLIVEEGLKLVKADYGSLLLLQHEELKRVHASSSILYQIKPHKNCYLYKAIETQNPFILDRDQIIKCHSQIKGTKIKSNIILPLSSHNKPIGVLTFMSLKERSFTDREVHILKLFVPLVMLAIRRAQLHDENVKALEARDLFISTAAHELRTPLTTINGYAQLLYSKLSKANTPESRWVEELSWESYRLTSLVNELLEIDRIKTGQFRYVWTECLLKDIINRALMDFRFTRPENKVVFKNKLLQNKDRVIGDYNKLMQVIINLLDNAAKFSPLDKEITITLRHRADFIILEIQDEGIGISKKDLPLVFEKYYRGEHYTGEGMGVGLFLAKNIISQHHGTIRLKSKENAGTMVEIKLPEVTI